MRFGLQSLCSRSTHINTVDCLCSYHLSPYRRKSFLFVQSHLDWSGSGLKYHVKRSEEARAEANISKTSGWFTKECGVLLEEQIRFTKECGAAGKASPKYRNNSTNARAEEVQQARRPPISPPWIPAAAD